MFIKSKKTKMPRNYKSLFNLDDYIEQYILSFCIDKRLCLKKVMEQFLKGGFWTINLNPRNYVMSQENNCKKMWCIDRPEVRTESFMYGSERRVRSLKFKYKSKWNHKNCGALVEFTKNNGGTVLKWSGRHPVSKWLKCIKKFETLHPVIALQYITNPRKFGVKGVSEFYVKKREKSRLKRLNLTEDEKAELFWYERKSIELKKRLKMLGFVKNQTVRLSFSGAHWQGLMFFDGTCEFDLWNGSLVLPPCGNNRFNQDIVDKCHNTLKIRVNFCDGETRVYTLEKFLLRVRTSKNQFEQQTKLNNRLLGANQRATNDVIQYFTHDIGQTQPVYINANTFTVNIFDQTFFKVTVGKVKNVLFNKRGDLIGVLDNGVIKTCMERYKIDRSV